MLTTVLEYKVSGHVGLKDTKEARKTLGAAIKALGPDGTDSDSKKFVSHVKTIVSLCQFKSFCKQDPVQPRNKHGVLTEAELLLIGYLKLLVDTGDKKHTISVLRLFSCIPKIEENEMFTDTLLHNLVKMHLEWFNDNHTLVEDNQLLLNFIVRCISHVVENETNYPKL